MGGGPLNVRILAGGRNNTILSPYRVAHLGGVTLELKCGGHLGHLGGVTLELKCGGHLGHLGGVTLELKCGGHLGGVTLELKCGGHLSRELLKDGGSEALSLTGPGQVAGSFQ